MKSHRIRVKVEIVECEEDQPISKQPERLGDGEFELLISEAVAGSIDDCEQALLQANYPALRDALSQHLAEFSKKKLSEQAPDK
ncbi:MAG: hypothetical protein L0312_09915 [Acidobacteria bacterium]|nr:hypothetical protein [Acidobacteriota bacterium]